jgi:hypothetical protein
VIQGATPYLIQPVQVPRGLDRGLDLGVDPKLLAGNLLLRTNRRGKSRSESIVPEDSSAGGRTPRVQIKTAGSSRCTSDSTNYINSWSSSRMALRFSKGYRRPPRDPAAITGASADGDE